MSSVWTGTWEDAPTDENVLMKSISAPYVERDYLCAPTGCYTLEFTFDAIDELSFTIESWSQALEIGLSADSESPKRLAYCVDASTGLFDNAPTANPTTSFVPTAGPSVEPSSSGSP